MKKVYIILFVFLTMLLSACQRELPPEPGSPGVIGKASGYENVFSPPDKFYVTHDPLYFGLYDGVSQGMSASAQYVWHTGYYLSLDEPKWVAVDFSGNKIADKWITNMADASFSYETSEIDETKPGVVLAYSCNKEGNVWDCHGNKWMLQTFKFKYTICEDGIRRCNGNIVETCTDNTWVTSNVCAAEEICRHGECELDLPEDPNAPGGCAGDGCITELNLADYPAPFIENGVIQNTLIVVGREDEVSNSILGAIDIATSLQAVATTTLSVLENYSVQKINPIPVGLIQLDEDAVYMRRNKILVGHPCYNELIKQFIGDNCHTEFEQGKGMIKFFQYGDNAYLIVTGYGPTEILAASRVLHDFEDYDMEGDEVEIVTTSLNEITVNRV